MLWSKESSNMFYKIIIKRINVTAPFNAILWREIKIESKNVILKLKLTLHSQLDKDSSK